MRTATACAHPNIALVKYWGKQNDELNIPATPSLSVTLSQLKTTTRIEEAQADVIVLDGVRVDDAKILRWLETVRHNFEFPPLRIESSSNFPASSGLASSASGFAALSLALSDALELDWSLDEICEWARRGSASAARSLHGGFVTLEPLGESCRVSRLAKESDWDLSVVVAVTSSKKKAIGSTTGMVASRESSPFYDAWLDATREQYVEAVDAVKKRNFNLLASLAEASCRQMHALMLSTEPALIYWNSGTLKCIEAVIELRLGGCEAFYTIDAGAHVKVVTKTQYLSQVQEKLGRTEGVEKILLSGIGGKAAIC